MEWRSSMLRKDAANNGVEEGESCRRDGSTDDGCAYSTLQKMICFLETDATGKPIRKCEMTKQRLRKCAGRPQELVDSNVEVTEEDASTGHSSLLLDYDTGAGNKSATSHQWHERKSVPGGAVGGGEFPFRGLFERNSPAFPGSLEVLMKDVFGGPLGSSEEGETVQPSTTPPKSGEQTFSWFWGSPFTSRNPKAPAAAACSPDQSTSQQKVADYYEALARGIQEV